MANIEIKDVSDTSLWVAYYRAKESERSDALFHDPLAKVLVGERGQKIAESMQRTNIYTEWAVVSRTVMIDEYIHRMVQQGIDTIINLGAGLDTRPYRMNLPATIHWIEVDFAHIIDYKNTSLASQIPTCQLTRVALDLANDQKRKDFLQQTSRQAKRVAVLTEGVIIYLTEQQVATLADDLYAQPNFEYWINEYFTPEVYRYLKSSGGSKALQNAPFQFYPLQWIGFFEEHKWTPKEIQYSGVIASKHNRIQPMPWWVKIIMRFASQRLIEKTKKMSGYQLLQRI